MKLFELFATLGLDMSGFDKGVKDAERKAAGLGNSIQNGIGTKAVWLGNMLNDVTKSVVQTFTRVGVESLGVGAEIEAANAQFEAAFGALQDEAAAAFDAISEETNILPTRLKEVGTKGYSQLKGSGLEANEALDQSQRLLRLAADAAAYYDISLEAADERLRSFMRGNTEAGDAIGLFTSEAQRDEAALEKYGQKWLDLTEAQKQMLMLGIAEEIYQQSGAIGQAAREGDSWANVLANLAESWRQIVGAFGQPLTDAITPILEKVTTFLLENKERVSAFGETVAGFVETGLQKAIDAFQWCIDNQETLMQILTVVALGFLAIHIATNPIKAAIEGIIAVSALLIANWEEIKAAAARIWGAITDAINGAVEAFYSFIGLQAGTPDTTSYGTTSLGDQTVFTSNGIPDFVPGMETFNFTGKASGMPYVPFDNYAAFLHRGEAVLTRQQADEYRRSSQIAGLPSGDLVSAIREALGGALVSMDGKSVGQLILPEISRELARETRNGRRYGV